MKAQIDKVRVKRIGELCPQLASCKRVDQSVEISIPIPRGPIPPVRAFAKWGYYSFISLALLFTTIQKADGKNGRLVAPVKSDQAAATEVCQIPPAQESPPKSNCGAELPSSGREGVILPFSWGQLSSHEPKKEVQFSNESQ